VCPRGITKPAIRPLVRRVGGKRIFDLIYEETCGMLKAFLEKVIRYAVTYTKHAKRKTFTAMDVVYVLIHRKVLRDNIQVNSKGPLSSVVL
jgi:histone H4